MCLRPDLSISASASGPIVGIVILVLILLALVGFAVFAKIKGLFCFAGKLTRFGVALKNIFCGRVAVFFFCGPLL